jgi:CheY-like chemotaxis protein
MTPTPARILVVDDNDALRENLAEALELEGYEVAVAEDGRAALARLEEDPPFDAVLLDLMMPGMDGRELLHRIREDPRLTALRVVITTGHTGARARAGVPADAFLTKPFGVRELLAALRQVGAPGGASGAPGGARTAP